MGLQLPNGPPPAQMVLAQPLNDVQLVAMVAAQLHPHRGVAAAVSMAIAVVAESAVQVHAKLPAAIRIRQQQLVESQ